MTAEPGSIEDRFKSDTSVEARWMQKYNNFAWKFNPSYREGMIDADPDGTFAQLLIKQKSPHEKFQMYSERRLALTWPQFYEDIDRIVGATLTQEEKKSFDGFVQKYPYLEEREWHQFNDLTEKVVLALLANSYKEYDFSS